MYVAARTTSPADAVGLQVGAQGEAETMLAALARARRVLNPQAAATLYDGADLARSKRRPSFPSIRCVSRSCAHSQDLRTGLPESRSSSCPLSLHGVKRPTAFGHYSRYTCCRVRFLAG